MISKDRHKIVPASYLLLEKDGKFLMLRRFNTGYRDGEYSLISGHVDPNESPRHTMVREAQEEAGIEILPEDLTLFHVCSRKAADFERIDFFWSCSKWTGEPTNIEPEKCDDLSWFDKDSLPENMVPELRSALNGLQNDKFYSEINWS